MNDDAFARIATVLADKFQVDRSLIHPEATLDGLGLDSLTLMEFVFEVEDRFSVRIPEDKLDPRQAGVTLARLAGLLDAEGDAAPALASQANAA